MRSVTLTEARNRLLRIAREIEREPRTVVEVVKRGRRVLALLSAERYEALLETLEILGDEETTAKLRRALREIAGKRGIPWETAKRRLGIQG